MSIKFTDNQLTVMRLLMEGLNYKQIAKYMDSSVPNINRYIEFLMHKLHCHKDEHLIEYAKTYLFKDNLNNEN